ncbi:MAG: SDR family oxidoreductase [Betaproteobacteria bacterium]|nr:SDR family oxidoreductase [Betaproteobacteria bacterium]
MRMKNKVALVTGAASGLGRATALRLSEEGAQVVCVDASAGAVAQTARTIITGGGEAMALVADVTDESACARMVADTLARFGRLTTVVNSAGVRPERPGATPTLADWRRVIDINLTGTFLVSRAATPALTASSGSITNLASIYGLVGGSTGASYAASKGAIVNLTRQLALELAPAVRVNCVCPGVIETPMTAGLRQDPAWSERVLKRYPLGRFGQPEEIAAAILYLASDEAAFVTGIALPVDGGYTAG